MSPTVDLAVLLFAGLVASLAALLENDVAAVGVFGGFMLLWFLFVRSPVEHAINRR